MVTPQQVPIFDLPVSAQTNAASSSSSRDKKTDIPAPAPFFIQKSREEISPEIVTDKERADVQKIIRATQEVVEMRAQKIAKMTGQEK